MSIIFKGQNMTSDNHAQPDAQFDNFFALFEQPVQFDLSQQTLDQRLRLLQKRYHPDNIATVWASVSRYQSSLSNLESSR